MEGPKVSLQISLAPTDLPSARHVVPHQLRQWAGQVDEIVFTVDLHRSRGRYADAWAERLPGLRQVVNEWCERYPNTRALDVDYSEEAAAGLSARFFGGRPIPVKDWNGGPFYSYIFCLGAVRTPYILHLDCDMLFGGGSQDWVAEALGVLRERPDVLACSPLPGPPTADGTLRSQTLEREPYTSPAYRAPYLSSRIFLMDIERFESVIGHLPLLRAPTRYLQMRALLDGNPPYEFFEYTFAHAMREHSLIRLELLGNAPGMWAVHPKLKPSAYYDGLEALIQRIESGDIPEGQRGHHDLNDSLVPGITIEKSRQERLLGHAKLAITRPLARGATGGVKKNPYLIG